MTKFLTRVQELVDDGYLVRDKVNPQMLILTFKGLDVLIAFADRPIVQGALRKDAPSKRNALGKNQ